MRVTTCEAMKLTICIAVAIGSFLSLMHSAHAVQRMGIAKGTSVLSPKSSTTVRSRCLDEHAEPPTQNNRYTQVLSDNPEDITVSVGSGPEMPFAQATEEGIVSFTGYSTYRPGGRAEIGRMRINNLTDSTVSVFVHRFTPIGTKRHRPLGHDISGFSKLNQRDLWGRQAEIRREDAKARYKEEEARRREEEEARRPFEEAKRRVEEARLKEEEELRNLTEQRNQVLPGEEITNSIGMTLRLIPAGKFVMGLRRDDDIIQHEVTLTESFYMGTTEVTQAQWEAVMGSNPSQFRGADRPVDSVSWEEAHKFCKKLSRQERNVTYRLPTAAEWEYSCRAGRDTPYYWFWNDEMDGKQFINEYAWYSGNSYRITHSVGSKKPNPWGLFDMSGNVREWCADLFDGNYYDSAPKTNPIGRTKGSGMRMSRGGAFNTPLQYCRSGHPDGIDEGSTEKSSRCGFRVVRIP